jgi:MoaA/NifB/PqqE/SkfB family radical SAM enzyme
MGYSIDWFITTKCNDTCKFCYAPLNFRECDLKIEDYYKLCDRIKKLGFEKVTICGGEPTLNKYIVVIVQYLYQIGIKVIFYTNGIELEVIKQVVNYIDYLSLPIDSVWDHKMEQESPELRSLDQIKNVFHVLDYLEETHKQHLLRVKIGTVVTKKNINNLMDVYESIRKYSIIKHWRLYQFSPGEKGRLYRDEYEISDEEYSNIQEKFSALNKDGFTISFRTKSDNVGYCIIMDQEGEIFKYNEKYEKMNLNIFDKTLREIISAYDIDKNIKQKEWINT